MKAQLLVIGYGNELRGDDGAGPTAARAVAAWQCRGIRALDVHQLLPELAAEVAGAERVVFIDADVAGLAVRLTPVGPHPVAALGHMSDPATVLFLASRLYGSVPPTWLITIPGERFELGEGLSPRAQAGVAAALRLVRNLAPAEVPDGLSVPGW